MVSTLNSRRGSHWLHNENQTSLSVIQRPCNELERRGAHDSCQQRHWGCLAHVVWKTAKFRLFASPLLSLRTPVWRRRSTSACTFISTGEFYKNQPCPNFLLKSDISNRPYIHFIENNVRKSWKVIHLNRRELLPPGFWAVSRRVVSASSRVSARTLK